MAISAASAGVGLWGGGGKSKQRHDVEKRPREATHNTTKPKARAWGRGRGSKSSEIERGCRTGSPDSEADTEAPSLGSPRAAAPPGRLRTHTDLEAPPSQELEAGAVATSREVVVEVGEAAVAAVAEGALAPRRTGQSASSLRAAREENVVALESGLCALQKPSLLFPAPPHIHRPSEDCERAVGSGGAGIMLLLVVLLLCVELSGLVAAAPSATQRQTMSHAAGHVHARSARGGVDSVTPNGEEGGGEGEAWRSRQTCG